MRSLFKALLTISIVLNGSASFSQENYLAGYLVEVSGDTVKGFIDYRNWAKNPKEIFFKEKITDAKKAFSPLTSKGFGVLDEVYESAIVKMESLKQDDTSELRTEPDTTFLQLLVGGKKSLYFLKNQYGKSQFYIKQDAEIELLIYKKYKQELNGTITMGENNKYLRQLNYYLQNCSEIQSKILTLKYNEKSIQKLFQFYNECISSEIFFMKKAEKITAETGILFGLSSTSLKFKGSGYPYLTKVEFKTSLNFSGGLFIDLILPRNQKKWSIYNEFLFNSYKTSATYNDYISENQYTITHTDLRHSYLKLNNMLRFKYPLRNTFAYFNIGISNGYMISEKNHKNSEATFFTFVNTSSGKALDSRKHEQGYLLGIGAIVKKYGLELRYEKGNGISAISGINSASVRYSILLNYRF